MANTTDIREWAKAQGIEGIGGKGPLSAEIRAQYDQAHTAGNGDDPAGGAYPGEDGAEVVTAASAPAAPQSDPRQAERVPTRPRAATSARGRGFLARLRGPSAGPRAKPAAKAGKKLPRVSLASLIEDGWSQMAFASSGMPPMQRLLQAQAPFAGLALEDALAGTVIDRALQPVARAEDKAKAVGGVMFPPMALMMALATAPVPQYVEGTDPPEYVWPEPTTRHKGALLTLRWSLMLWSEAGEARLDEYRARAEQNAERGAQADRFMAFILGYDDPAEGQGDEMTGGPGAEAAAVNAEDEAVRRAQQLFGG
jgi:hypothetical protein